MALKLLVVEGNAREMRQRLIDITGSSAGQAYARVLAELAPDAACDICEPADEAGNLPGPEGLDAYDGVAITGSALNIYNGGPEITRQIDLVRAVFAAKTPLFGSCWGLQVCAVAAGGTVAQNPRGRQLGIARNIYPTELGRAHPLLAGRAPAYDAPCVHSDIVTVPPPDCVVLARNGAAPVQAAEIRHAGGLAWAVQYHPEYSLGSIADIFTRAKSRLEDSDFFRSPGELEAFCADLRALDADATRFDIAWKLGVQPCVIDAPTRRLELTNWIERLVRPAKSARGRA